MCPATCPLSHQLPRTVQDTRTSKRQCKYDWGGLRSTSTTSIVQHLMYCCRMFILHEALSAATDIPILGLACPMLPLLLLLLLLQVEATGVCWGIFNYPSSQVVPLWQHCAGPAAGGVCITQGMANGAVANFEIAQVSSSSCTLLPPSPPPPPHPRPPSPPALPAHSSVTVYATQGCSGSVVRGGRAGGRCVTRCMEGGGGAGVRPVAWRGRGEVCDQGVIQGVLCLGVTRE